ncbi:MAG TPA: metal-dependent transcriptional regulator [bacterium]|nr:metal-dependent transcriptional regulator [bacterium]HPS30007.1 metal-dependent transcriptional regulator [bacterium]
MKSKKPALKRLLTSTQEDYLEAVLDLTTVKTVTRNKDLADRLGVKRATVTRSIKALALKGLIDHETHGYISLTEKGKEIAVEITSRHNFLNHFFRDILELEKKEAEMIACRVEHLISGKALAKFKAFVDKVDKNIKEVR